MNKILENIKRKLIVSCQALEDDPLHSSFIKSSTSFIVGVIYTSELL